MDEAARHFSIFHFVFFRLGVCYELDFYSNNQKRERAVTSVIYGFCLSSIKNLFFHRVFWAVRSP
jgi:hypothetical protein